MSELPPLTHLETRVLLAIDQHIESSGQSPTIAELAQKLRLKSKGTVHRYVQSLINKGRLHRAGTGWRGLRLVAGCTERVDVGAGVVADMGSDAREDKRLSDAQLQRNKINNNIEKLSTISRTNVDGYISLPANRVSTGDFQIPLLGRIAAGQPIEAIDRQDSLNLAEFFIGPDRYALRVTGDSMMDAGILDGDTVILRKTSQVRTGDIVVALIDGQEATLKRLGNCADDMVELIPENAQMKTMHYSSERISFQGVLVGQLRSY